MGGKAAAGSQRDVCFVFDDPVTSKDFIEFLEKHFDLEWYMNEQLVIRIKNFKAST